MPLVNMLKKCAKKVDTIKVYTHQTEISMYLIRLCYRSMYERNKEMPFFCRVIGFVET